MRNILRSIVRFIYNKLRYTKFAEAVEEEFEMQSYSGVTSRHFEYPYGISRVVKLDKKKKVKKILDAGAFGSPFGPILASLGLNITGVDIVKWEIKFPGFKYVVGDLKKLPFKSESFDIITNISTIEHCGLPRFGEKEVKGGDVIAMQEIYRVCVKGGYCILTTPYSGKGTVFYNKHRVYDKKTFKKLIGKFRILETSFFAPISVPHVFEPCTQKQIEKIDSTLIGDHGVICTVLKKP